MAKRDYRFYQVISGRATAITQGQAKKALEYFFPKDSSLFSRLLDQASRQVSIEYSLTPALTLRIVEVGNVHRSVLARVSGF